MSGGLRSTQAPSDVQRICDDWHDGVNSAMYAVYRRREFSPKRLQAELRKVLNSLNPDCEKDRPALEAAKGFAERELAIEEAETLIRQAVARAAKAALDARDASDLFAQALQAEYRA